MVEVLVKYGADVNSVSDTGSTPVRSACFMTHLDVVRLLVANNADIQKPNHNGGTCLINSVQSVELCKFLLENGAAVNAEDIQNKTGNSQMTIDISKLQYRYSSLSNTYFFTFLKYIFPVSFLALHYAIQEHRHETTKLLLKYQANPFIFSKWGDDALQTSCLKVPYICCHFLDKRTSQFFIN